MGSTDSCYSSLRDNPLAYNEYDASPNRNWIGPLFSGAYPRWMKVLQNSTITLVYAELETTLDANNVGPKVSQNVKKDGYAYDATRYGKGRRRPKEKVCLTGESDSQTVRVGTT